MFCNLSVIFQIGNSWGRNIQERIAQGEMSMRQNNQGTKRLQGERLGTKHPDPSWPSSKSLGENICV